MTDRVESALSALQRYLQDEIPPSAATDAIATLMARPPDILMQRVATWVVAQNETRKIPIGELLVFSLKKIYIMGELGLLDRVAVADFLDRVTSIALRSCPVDERDDLRAKLTEMRLSRDVTAARAEAQSVKVTTLAAKAPPPAEDDDAQLAKRFTLVLERLTKQMEGAGQQQDASQANPQALAQLLTMAANRSHNGQQLNDYLNMIRPLTGGKEGNVFVILGGGVPAWDLPTLAPGSQAPPPAQVSAMEKIIDLSEDPLVTMKRFRELVTAAVQKFNDGSLAATVWMLDVAEDTITEKKLDPAGVDQIRAEAANAMSSMQLRKYTENKNKHG